MATLKVTLLPAGALTAGARWRIDGVTTWQVSGATVTHTFSAYDTLSFLNVDGYLPLASETAVAGDITRTYTAVSTAWPSTWGPPISGCYFKGQVILGGRYYTTAQIWPSDSRIIRWSEIGAFKFLGATANPKKNEAGFIYTKEHSDETVMRLLPLRDFVVAYADSSITFLKPVAQPAPTYGVEEFATGVGILNPLAVDSSMREHLFVNTHGDLCRLAMGQYGVGYIIDNLGYRHIFGAMQEDFDITTGKGLIVVTYNPSEEEYYISDGRRSFVYNKYGLTEVGVAITSVIDIKSAIVASDLFDSCQSKFLGGATNLASNEYLYLETDIIDFETAAVKTINQVEIGGGFGADANALVMVKWRNNRSDAFRETTWKRVSPNGVCTPVVSGTDFRVCLRIKPAIGTVINDITVEWQLSDKSSVRGHNASNAAS